MNATTTVDERCSMLADHAMLTVHSWGPCAVAYRSLREIADRIIAERGRQAGAIGYATRVIADIVKLSGPLSGMRIQGGYSVPCATTDGALKLILWVDQAHLEQRTIPSCGGDYRFASLAREVGTGISIP